MILNSKLQDLLVKFYFFGCAVEVITALDPRTLQRTEKVDLVQQFSHMLVKDTNVSLSVDHRMCPTLHISPYDSLEMATQWAFGPSFSDEFSLLMELRSSQREVSSVLTVLNSHHHIHLQLRLGPHSLTFISTQHREYEFPVGSLCDGQWHRVSLGVSPLWLEVHVDCVLVERVNWAYPWQQISSEGVLMIGGRLEAFETPFEGDVRQMTFVMGDPDASRDHCTLHQPPCNQTMSAARKRLKGVFALMNPPSGRSVVLPSVHSLPLLGAASSVPPLSTLV